MNSTFRTRAALALIFLLTICTRLAFQVSNPHPITLAWGNGALAHNIVNDGHWFQLNGSAGPRFSLNAPAAAGGRLLAPDEVDLKYADAHPQWHPFVFEPVGETVLLAGVWKVIGDQSYLSDVLMKIVLDAFAALLVYRVAMLLFRRRRAALIAALLYALYPPIAAVVVNPNRDFWSIDFTLAILALYVEGINSKRPTRWFVACGALAGLGGYFATGVLILPAAMALAGISFAGWRTTLRRVLVMTAAMVLLILPWTIRNYNDFHTFIPLRAGAGENLWSGLAEIPNPYGPKHKDYEIYEFVRHARPDLRWLTPAWDSYLRERSFAVIEQHPLFYLHSFVHRVWISSLGELDVEWMHAGTKTPFAYARGPLSYVIEQPFQLLQVMLMPLVFLLAMLSLGFTWRRYKQEHLILIALALATVLPYLFLSDEGRYLMPMAISYFMWIGVAGDELLLRLKPVAAGRNARMLGRTPAAESKQ